MKKPVNIIDRFENCHWPFADTYGNFYDTKRGYISTENLFQVPQKQGLVDPITDLRFHLKLECSLRRVCSRCATKVGAAVTPLRVRFFGIDRLTSSRPVGNFRITETVIQNTTNLRGRPFSSLRPNRSSFYFGGGLSLGSRRSGMFQSCFFWDKVGDEKSVSLRSESDEVRAELLRGISRSLRVL